MSYYIPLPRTKQRRELTSRDFQESELFQLLYYIKQQRDSELLGRFCLPISTETLKEAQYRLPMLDRVSNISLYVTDKNFSKFKVDIAEDYLEMFHTCMDNPKIDYIFVLLAINMDWIKEAHANALLFDKLRKKVYLFEPKGESEFSGIYRAIPKILANLGVRNYIFISSDQWSPRESFQRLEKYQGKLNYNFCAVWTAWILDLLMHNPDANFEEIQYYAIDDLKKKYPNFLDFVNEYTFTIRQITEPIIHSLGIHTTQVDNNGMLGINNGYENLVDYVHEKRDDYRNYLSQY